MKPFIAVVLAALLLASCTQRRYAHYSYVKKGKYSIEQQARLNKKSIPIDVPAISPLFTINQGNKTGAPLLPPMPVSKPKPVLFKEHVTQKQKSLVTKSISPKKHLNHPVKGNNKGIKKKKELNPNIKRSLLLLLITLTPFSFVLFLLVPYFIIKSFKLSLKGLKEIDAEPDKYRGEGLGTFLMIFTSLEIVAMIFFILVEVSLILIESGSFAFPFFLAQ